MTSSAGAPSTTVAVVAGPSTTAARGDVFTSLPADPRGPAASPSVVWTGDDAIVVGGRDANGAPVHGTAAYRPSTNTWRRLADPLAGERVDPLVAWTGQAMLVIGGDNPDGSLLVSWGSSYRPSTDSWTVIASLPVGYVSDRSPSVWTGSELLVWPWDGGGPSMPITPIVYDPGTDTWRQLPEPPVVRRQQAASVWTGSEWVVWGRVVRAADDVRPLRSSPRWSATYRERHRRRSVT